MIKIKVFNTEIGLFQIENHRLIDELILVSLHHEPEVLKLERTWEQDFSSPTSSRYMSYNFLSFSGTDTLKEIIGLKVRDFFGLKDMNLWCQCWMNIHRKDQYLDWHTHEKCLISGHLTLQCEADSETVYFNEKFFRTQNNKGLLTIIGKPDVMHRTTLATGSNPRISIAFDVFESDVQKEESWVKL